MPKLNQWLFGRKPKVKQKKTVTPEQEEMQKLIREGLEKGSGPYQDIFGEFNQKEFEQGVSEPALKNFQERILPMLQEKFIANNQVGGSGVQRESARAGSDLQAQLAQLMYQAQQQQKQNRAGGINTLLGMKNFENVYRPGSKGAVQGVAEGVAPLVGQAIGAAATGGMSATASGMNNMANNARNVTQAVVG